MTKKIISILLIFAIMLTVAPVAGASERVLFSEDFSSYAENDTAPSSVASLSGVDSRVINDGGNKAFFSRAWGEGVLLQAPFSQSYAKETVISAKLKLSGAQTTGKLFTFVYSDTKENFLLLDGGFVKLYNGKVLTGISGSSYKEITICINWRKGVCSVYVSGRCVAENWLLGSNIQSMPTALQWQIDYNEETQTDFFIDDIRVYEGSELPNNKDFPAQKSNGEVLPFTPTAEINTSPEIIKDYEFNGSGAGVSIITQGGKISPETDEDGTGTIHLYADEKTKSSSYFDINEASLENIGKYVVDMRFRINTLTGNASLGILDTKDKTNAWRLGYDVGAGGALTAHTGGSMGNVEVGEWIRFSVIYDIYQGKADVYLNGELHNSHSVPDSFFPVMFRTDLINKEGSIHDTSIDYIRIYTGKKLISDEYFVSDTEKNETGELVSVVDPADRLSEALSGNTVFMINNNTMYIDGEKKSYYNESFRPYIIDGTLMMPRNMFSLFSNESVEFYEETGEIKIGSKAVLKLGETSYTLNGKAAELNAAPALSGTTLYFPLRGVAEQILGKKITWDNRGFVVIGDKELKTFEYHFTDRIIQWHPIDLIYRFMQFENPTGKRIIEDVEKNCPNRSHPRVWYTEDDISFILGKVQSDSKWQKLYNAEIAAADSYLKRKFDSQYTIDDSGKQSSAISFQQVMESLATAYLLTKDSTYAAKGVEIMKGYASWDTMGWQSTELASGHWVAGMGIGFDAFYNYMASSEQGKKDMQYIKDNILRLTFNDHINAYQGNAGPTWITMQDNFTGVLGGGLMTLLIAVCDEEDMKEECEFLLENVLKSLYKGAELFFPNGGYYESVMYTDYMWQNLTIAVDALFNACSTDYGLGSVPGFTDGADYFTHLQLPGYSFNFHDSNSAQYYGDGSREFIAYRYNLPHKALEAKQSRELAGEDYDLKSLFYYTKATENVGEYDVDVLPDNYFFSGEVGSMRNSHKTGNPTAVFYHGGWTQIPHDMLDLGEFVFFADGVPWAVDAGGDDYNFHGYFTLRGYELYAKRPEGKNCLVINPSDDGTGYYGQKLRAVSSLCGSEFGKAKGAWAALDLTDPYERDVNSYKRGYYFGDDRNSLLVQDELSVKKNSEIYWFMHTKADITVEGNNKAILTQDGKSCTVEIYCSEPGYEVKVMDPIPLPTSPNIEGQDKKEGVRKLTVHIPDAKDDVVISVKLSPDNGDYVKTRLDVTPIAEWSVPDGTVSPKPEFTEIRLDGEMIDSFRPGGVSYEVDLPYGTHSIPHITASSTLGTVNIVQAEALSGTAVLTIKAEGFRDIECRIKFNVSTEKPITVTDALAGAAFAVGKKGEQLVPVSIIGKTLPEPANPPANMIDGDMTTRATQEGEDMWFEADLGEVMDIGGVSIAFYDGDKRKSFFEILYSEDGTNFRRVFDGDSTGLTSGWESISIPGRVRYIRYVGYGNSTSGWNSITELRAFK